MAMPSIVQTLTLIANTLSSSLVMRLNLPAPTTMPLRVTSITV